jgi:hypothetical protein
MRRLHFSAASLLLGAALAASTPILAARSPQDHPTHEWNTNEDPHWHQYLKEKHRKDHDWDHATKQEQKDYWKWRDAHPDAR